MGHRTRGQKRLRSVFGDTWKALVQARQRRAGGCQGGEQNKKMPASETVPGRRGPWGQGRMDRQGRACGRRA